MKQAIVVWVSLGIGFAMGSAQQKVGPKGEQGNTGPMGPRGDSPRDYLD